MDRVVERFLSYTKEFTTSDPESSSFPSTDRQLTFMRRLELELKALGLQEVALDENGYLMATIPANGVRNGPVVGFIAHVDTSPDFPGENVQPQIIENYKGQVIPLKNNVSIDPADFPEILSYCGQDIITADGTTLLGADDKAGVAEIITAAEILLANREIRHGMIRIGFTPDEEIDRKSVV